MLGMFEAGLFPGVNYYLSWSVSPPINVIKSTTFRNSSLLLRDLKVTMKTFSLFQRNIPPNPWHWSQAD